MGNSLSMARSKEARDSRRANDKLLDAGGSSIPSHSSIRRNKRKKAASAVRRAKGCKIKDSKKKGKASARAENSDGGSSRRGRHKQDDKDRQSDRGTEGKNTTIRRSASELGIKWIGDFCPNGQPHFLISNYNLNGGSLFKCKHCLQHIWLPIEGATTLTVMINSSGPQAGYCKFLDKHKEAKIIMAKMQDLWRMKQSLSNDKEFAKLVTSVMEDKEYDKAS